jgi:hypothetical protein
MSRDQWDEPTGQAQAGIPTQGAGDEPEDSVLEDSAAFGVSRTHSQTCCS